MPRENSYQPGWWELIFLAVAVILIALDQLAKNWIRTNIPLNEVLWDFGVFRIINIRNTGAAFGIFQGQVPVLTIISTLGVIAILAFVFIFNPRYRFLTPLRWITLSLILAGTAGNLIDRAVFGYVTDFLDLRWWPAFNLADSCTTVGSVLFAISIIPLLRNQ